MTHEFNAIESFVMVQNGRGAHHTMQDYMRKYQGCSGGRRRKGRARPRDFIVVSEGRNV